MKRIDGKKRVALVTTVISLILQFAAAFEFRIDQLTLFHVNESLEDAVNTSTVISSNSSGLALCQIFPQFCQQYKMTKLSQPPADDAETLRFGRDQSEMEFDMISSKCSPAMVETIFISSSVNCRAFYKCKQGRVVKILCPSGLYDPFKAICNTNQSSCGAMNYVTVVPAHHMHLYDLCENDANNDQRAASETRKGYYQCVASYPVFMTCNPRQYFNSFTGVCEWDEEILYNWNESSIFSDEDDETTTIGSTDDPDIRFSLPLAHWDHFSHAIKRHFRLFCCNYKNRDTRHALPNCSMYVQCIDREAILFQCPDGLLFDRNESICVRKENSLCNFPSYEEQSRIRVRKFSEANRVDINSELLTYITMYQKQHPLNANETTSASQIYYNETCFVKSNRGKMFVDIMNCSRFFLCTGGPSAFVPCPRGLNFNENAQICDWPQSCNCPGHIGTTICSGQENGRLIPAPDISGCFYQCVGETAMLMKCPTDLLFNPETGKCDWPENIPVVENVLTHTQNGVDNELVENVIDSTVSFTPAQNADSFYVGETEKKEFLFSYLKQLPPNEITGNARLQFLTKAEEICNNSDIPNKCYPDPNFCDRFFQCVDKTAIFQECPENLLFNPKISKCDWADEVTCETHVIQ